MTRRISILRPSNCSKCFHVSSQGELNVMRKTRIFWLAATVVAIGGLLMTLQTRPERGDTPERFDEAGEARVDAPDAAARSDLARRQPVDARIDMPQLYAAASSHVASLARYASRIGRDLPAAQPASRVWTSGSRVFA